ncbi:MAG: polyprenyl synthetase family protein [Omnitrophica WOR_2 bacterium]
MQQAISGKDSKFAGSALDLPRWVQLPGLCCQAAGGDSLSTDDIAAAWFLFYAAAHIMDSLEDRDAPEPWWETAGSGAALAAATGLYFTASSIISQLSSQRIPLSAASQVIRDFNISFLRISAGQYQDIQSQVQSLEQYRWIATAKSGAFFALACRCGARLATRKAGLIQAYSQFGEYLGQLIQVLDDLEEYQYVGNPGKVVKIDQSLPVIYALEVSAEPERSRLNECLKSATVDERAALEALRLVEQSGAALYVGTEVERLRTLALSVLEQAAPLSPAREELMAFISLLVQPPH